MKIKLREIPINEITSGYTNNDSGKFNIRPPYLIYVCEGNDKEKLDWFETINIAGERLTSQELRNAIYMGSWVTDAKKKFSKTGCAVAKIGSQYLKGNSIRQEYLETALKWIHHGKVAAYMSIHQHDANADELWSYFENVINWVKTVFNDYRHEMQGIEWGELYNEFKDKKVDADSISQEVNSLMEDEDVTKKQGIYSYILNRKEKYLNIRQFSKKQKRETYERQKGVCPKCSQHFEIDKMEADHIKPWSAGGQTEANNCQMLCKPCNRTKSNK